MNTSQICKYLKRLNVMPIEKVSIHLENQKNKIQKLLDFVSTKF